MEFNHLSVLLNECLEGLNIKENGIYVDGTLGGAGHSSEILKRLSNEGRLIGIDQDTDALKAAKERLKNYSNVTFVHSNFSSIENVLNNLNIDGVDGILMDLGVSSYQLDEGERGFSYMKDAPLDMRMNRDNDFSAYNVINEYSEEDLYRIIRDYGEEKFAFKIADRIISEREKAPIDTTLKLADIISSAVPARARRDGHPARKSFQAIRIAVNGELDELETALDKAFALLNKEGRLAIITFHSLEDRMVKQKFKEYCTGCICPPDFPVCVCGRKPQGRLLTKKPIEPTAEEINENQRSRSAKLRVIIKNE